MFSINYIVVKIEGLYTRNIIIFIGKMSELDEIVLDDELIPEAKEGDKRDRKLPGYPRALNAVQLEIERTVLGICKRDGLVVHGLIIDAIGYLVHKYSHEGDESEDSLDSGYLQQDAAVKWFRTEDTDKMKAKITRFATEINRTLVDAVIDYKIRNEEKLTVLRRIYERYENKSKFNQYEGRGGDRSQATLANAGQPYDSMWAPWFKKLRKEFWKIAPSSLKKNF